MAEPSEFPVDPQEAVERLTAMEADIVKAVVESRGRGSLAEVSRSTEADTIYAIDAVVEPIIERHMALWSQKTPLILIAEGIEDENGVEGSRVFPEGAKEEDALIRVISDPIDGTRGIMYDKRPAWSLAGVAPNNGPTTRLRDIFAAVMTELPTSKMGWYDVAWAISGRGHGARRVSLADGSTTNVSLKPSGAKTIDHGFAHVSNFFPATKVLASELMETIAREMIDVTQLSRATVFDDQYICTGGQWYELIAGHDRFSADLRPVFYDLRGLPEGLCVHPYDCACWLIAEEAGAILTDENGEPLDGPLDVTTGLSWVGYANPTLRQKIEPVLQDFLQRKRAERPTDQPDSATMG